MPDSSRPLRILVYVDDSRHWVPAVHAIGAFARATESRVTLLATEWSRATREAALAKAQAALDLPEDRVRAVSRVGLVEYVLPDEAHAGGYDLVAVGRLGSLDFLTNRLVSILIVRRTPSSVLLVRGKHERLERIVVATAGASHGEADVRAAIRVARVLGARVTVLHVLSQLALTEDAHDELSRVGAAFLESDAPEAAHLRRMRQMMSDAGVRGSVKVRVGPIVDEVLAEVTENQHDLLVLGAHEGEREPRFLYEDITALLLRASPVSCLVVRSRNAPAE